MHIHASGISIYATCHPFFPWEKTQLFGNLWFFPSPVPLEKMEPGVELHHLIFFGLTWGAWFTGKTSPFAPGRVARQHRQHGELDPHCHLTSLGDLRMASAGVWIRWRVIGHRIILDPLVECPRWIVFENQGFQNFRLGYIYLELVCPLFWGLNPPKQGLFQSKQGSFGFQAYIHHTLPGTNETKTQKPRTFWVDESRNRTSLFLVANIYLSFPYVYSFCFFSPPGLVELWERKHPKPWECF